MSAVGRCLSTSFVDPAGLAAFTACRLIPLDKCPGVRPIGVAETSRRLVGKAIMTIIHQDVQAAAGSLQLCAGQPAGCEAAVHAMRTLFAETDAEAVLLVDASNAFNRLNRRLTLLNLMALCPALAPIAINTYHDPANLFVSGEVLLSLEGTTQGDTLSMAIYAVVITPLIHKGLSDTRQQV